MKRLFLFYALFFTIQANSQQSIVRGIISIHNSEWETGKRQYVANAQVEDDFGKAQPRITDNNGQFSLIYVGVAEKAPVSFNVKKSGLQVVNIDALRAVAGQQEAIKISMATPDKVDDYKRNIYSIGKSEAEKKLEILLQKINIQVAQLQKGNTQDAKREKQLRDSISFLQQQYTKIEEQAMDLARRYAPINLDDASQLFRDAFSLFQFGKLDSALLLIQQANLSNKVDLVLQEEKRIKYQKQELKKEDSIKNERKKEIIQVLRLKADLHKTNFQFDSAACYYELLIKVDPDNVDNLFVYAFFLKWLNLRDKAIYYYKEALSVLFRNKAYYILQSYDSYRAALLNHLGLVYSDKNDINKAETFFIEALSIYQRLVNINPDFYKLGIAATQSNLGLIYNRKNEFEKAEIAFVDALNNYQRLATSNLQLVEPDIARTKSNLGANYSDKKEFDKAEIAYLQALEIRKRLERASLGTYESVIAETQNNLGNLYRERKEFNKAETALLEALKISQRLATTNPLTYEPFLATIQHNIGIVYEDKNETDKAEMAYLKALEIRKQLSKTDPQTYESEVAGTQNNLGNLYTRIKQFGKGETAYLEALHIYQQLARTNPQTYEPTLANIQNNIGDFYKNQKEISKAEEAYIKALEIRKRLTLVTPKIYEPDLAKTQQDLGLLYSEIKDYDKSEAAYLAALHIYQKLSINNPQTYEPEIAMVQHNIGNLYKGKNETDKAEAAYIESLEIRKRLAELNPQTYEPDLAETQNSLGALYNSKNELLKAEKFFLEAMQIYQRLSVANTQTYEPKIAMLQNNLGVLYRAQNELNKAEAAYLKALETRKRLVKINPQTYESDVATTQNNLGNLYNDKNEFDKAEIAYIDALSIYQRLAIINSQTYEIDLARIQNNLGYFYTQRMKFLNAEPLLVASLLLYDKWRNHYPQIFLNSTTRTAKNLLNLYIAIQDSSETKILKAVLPVSWKEVSDKLHNLALIDKYIAVQYLHYLDNYAWYALLASKFNEAENAAIEAYNIDKSQIWLKINLAHSLLFQNRYTEALKVYSELKLLKNTQGISYATICLEDLNALKKAGITCKDVAKIQVFLTK